MPNPDRRQFLAASLSGLGALSLGPLAKAAPTLSPTRPSIQGRLIVLRLNGGCDGLSLFPPYGLSTYQSRRPSLAFQAPNAGTGRVALELDSGVGQGLSPYCPELHQEWLRGQLAVVRKTGLSQRNGSHFEAQEAISTGLGAPNRSEPRGWLGRLRETYLTGELDVISIGAGSPRSLATVGPAPLRLEGIEDFNLGQDSRFEEDSIYRRQFLPLVNFVGTSQGGLRATLGSTLRRADQLSAQVQAGIANYQSPVTYPNSTLGRRLRDVARFLDANRSTRIIYTATGGFDTHSNQIGTEPNLFAGLSAALGALCADLRHLGLYHDTTILMNTEFGRRNGQNGNNGTDHGHASQWFLLGGAMRGGLFGPEITDTDVQAQNLGVAVDYRDLLAEIIGGGLGLDPTPIFPGHTFAQTALGLFP